VPLTELKLLTDTIAYYYVGVININIDNISGNNTMSQHALYFKAIGDIKLRGFLK